MEESMVQSKAARICVCGRERKGKEGKGREGKGREGGLKNESLSRNMPHQSLHNSDE
jgi:hypothetical protein